MKNLVLASDANDGPKKLEFAAPATTVSGEFYIIGDCPVVSVTSLANTVRGTYLVEQVIRYARNNGVTFSEGETVHWDSGAKELTNVALGNRPVGIATKDVAASDEVEFKMFEQAGPIGV